MSKRLTKAEKEEKAWYELRERTVIEKANSDFLAKQAQADENLTDSQKEAIIEYSDMLKSCASDLIKIQNKKIDGKITEEDEIAYDKLRERIENSNPDEYILSNGLTLKDILTTENGDLV